MKNLIYKNIQNEAFLQRILRWNITVESHNKTQRLQKPKEIRINFNLSVKTLLLSKFAESRSGIYKIKSLVVLKTSECLRYLIARPKLTQLKKRNNDLVQTGQARS